MTPPTSPTDRWSAGTAAVPATRFDDLFPDGDTRRRAGRWSPRRPALVVAAVTVVVVLAAVLAVRASGASSASYRTATAQIHDVASRFESVVTLEPVSQASVGFPTSGTVASVDVHVGDAVVVGQALASLDRASLEQGVRSAQAALDQAELTLTRALDGEDVSGMSGSRGASGATPSSGGTVTPAALTTTSTAGTTTSTARAQTVATTLGATVDPAVGQAQQAVLGAQQQADAALRRAQTALASAQAICAGTGTSTAAGADDPDATAPSQADTGEGTGQAADTDRLDACEEALAQVLAAQTEVSAAQTALADASVAYDTLLDELAATNGDGTAAAGGGASGATPGSSDQPAGDAGGSASTGAGGAATATTSAPSSKQLIAYQKAVDAAELDVAVAEQALAQATIVSPIDGTVVAVTLGVGDAVTSGSTDATIIIEGPGGYEATATVGVDDVADLAVGQAATVLVDGRSEPISGTVTSIALSDAAEATYLVVIGLSGDGAEIRNGSTGTASVTLDAASGALAVPTSAVAIDGTNGTVDVVTDGKAVTTSVTVGVIGDTWTQILRGLEEGDQVVLADLTEPLPGSATDTSSTGGAPTIGGGAFPGGGLPGGGAFPAGGLPTGRPGG